MRHMVLIGAALLLAAAGRDEPKGVATLGWMAGQWSTEGTGAWTEEHWAPERGGVMLGTNLSGEGERAGAYEYMRLAEEADGTIQFWGSPGGKPPVAFKLVRSAPGEAVFENPAHDFPTQIVYRRSGNTLFATVSGPDGANAQSWTFKRR